MLHIVPLNPYFNDDIKQDLLEDVSSKLETAHGFLAVYLSPGGEIEHTWETATGRINNNELLGALERIKFNLLRDDEYEDSDELP